MRYFRIFLLYLQNAFEYKSLSAVWFFISVVNCFLYLLFWRGSMQSEGISPGGMTLADITTYYLLLMIASSFLGVHADEDIAKRDIKQGFLSSYLLRPFSYIRMKFLSEIPWRIIQGLFGILVFIGSMIFFHIQAGLVSGYGGIIAAITIVILAYCVSFLWSMILGLSALWVIEYDGIQQLTTVIAIIFAGYLVPINVLPSGVRTVAEVLPFSYMAYYPIRAVQGVLTTSDVFRIISIQIFWIFLFYFCYRKMWKSGTKRFTGIGI